MMASFVGGMRRVQLALMHGTKSRRPITDDRAWHIKAAPQHWLTPRYAGQAGGGLAHKEGPTVKYLGPQKSRLTF